ncbi:hypothetical protein Salat_0214100 [Sesamum alatum]|uniref:Uncharacterized protein n=1 Tax=Sesamum alatum TaxID=300844 RepID=A0AAE1YXZ3_9LAMI|nr:hypothetical protein Salat_0214100 [Sesamum alatum]
MDASSPDQQVRLLELVEMTIQRICLERNQPPLKKVCQKHASGDRRGNGSGVLIILLSLRGRGHVPLLLPTLLPTHHTPISSFPVDSIPSNLHRTGPQNIRCNLCFENETLEKRRPGARRQPLPDELREMTDSVFSDNSSDIQLSNSTHRQKLEAVVNLEGADEIYSMKDLPMKDFEAKIWNSYGEKFCEESDSSQVGGWVAAGATGEGGGGGLGAGGGGEGAGDRGKLPDGVGGWGGGKLERWGEGGLGLFFN